MTDLELFSKELSSIQPDLKVLSVDKIHAIVKDKYGTCKVQKSSLLNNSKPTISTAIDKTQYFKNKLEEIQPDVEVLGEYLDSFERIVVRDKYGECSCYPCRLLQGAVPSVRTAVNRTKYFIEKSKEVHGDRYDYSKTKYISNLRKITVTCEKHGDFEQTPSNHLRSGGCGNCAYEDKIGYWYKNPKNKEKEAKFYILKITGNNEEFLKYGVTVNLKKRISSIVNESGKIYNVKVVKIISNTVEYCYQLEKRFKNLVFLKKINYKPILGFCGKNECFI